MNEVPLLTFVLFQSPEQLGDARAYKTDWLGKELQEEPTSVEAVASIYYSEAGSEFSSYHGGHAIVSVHLTTGEAARAQQSGLMRALQNPGLSVELELRGIEFTTHESMREKWRIPTLSGFLAGDIP